MERDVYKSVEKGMQRSKLRGDLGNAIALVGIAVGTVVGVASEGLELGVVVAIGSLAAGLWIAYGWTR